jgi:hypothetical protein
MASQIITYFSRESDLPLMIGLLVDTSRSQTGVLEPEREASHTFFDQGFTSYDQTSIGTAIEYAQREDTIIFSNTLCRSPENYPWQERDAAPGS